jgi:hypothetical protein
MGNFADAPMKREGQAVAYDDYDMKDRYIVDVWRGGYRIIVQRWNGSADIVGDYLTKQQADTILKIMEG